jgi:hypothetical protein
MDLPLRSSWRPPADDFDIYKALVAPRTQIDHHLRLRLRLDSAWQHVKHAAKAVQSSALLHAMLNVAARRVREGAARLAR